MSYLGITKDGINTNREHKDLISGQKNINLNLRENDDNKILFEIKRGLYKELKNSHLV